MTMRDDDGETWREYWLQRVGDELGRYVAAGGWVEVMTVLDDGRLVTLIELPGDVVVTLEAAVERGRLDQLYPVAGRSRGLDGNRAMTETPPAEGMPGPGERVQIILNAVRGPLGDRWIVEEPHPRLIADEVVVAWRRPLVWKNDVVAQNAEAGGGE